MNAKSLNAKRWSRSVATGEQAAAIIAQARADFEAAYPIACAVARRYLSRRIPERDIEERVQNTMAWTWSKLLAQRLAGNGQPGVENVRRIAYFAIRERRTFGHQLRASMQAGDLRYGKRADVMGCQPIEDVCTQVDYDLSKISAT